MTDYMYSVSSAAHEMLCKADEVSGTWHCWPFDTKLQALLYTVSRN